jgi:hypothetical protein
MSVVAFRPLRTLRTFKPVAAISTFWAFWAFTALRTITGDPIIGRTITALYPLWTVKALRPISTILATILAPILATVWCPIRVIPPVLFAPVLIKPITP